jgi:hypothetical protein
MTEKKQFLFFTDPSSIEKKVYWEENSYAGGG